ncbi:hypothetical protein BC941DRAFT_428831 [Chlamydoabsidia padenii]|nr:hypothetical protein BC941DRAFT_428831 [Chlamydoabsidia padenii]
MYQEHPIMDDMCTSTFDNGYDYPPPWTQGTNRQSPPPPLMMMMVKQEYPIERNDNMVSPVHQQQYYRYYQHTPTTGGFYGMKEDMCQPLMVDDYSSNMSSPDLATGFSLFSPSPTDVGTSSTSSPTFADSWNNNDMYSPNYSPHYSPSPYGMNQRHSFDEAMYFKNESPMLHETEDIMACAYSCNNNLMGHYRMDTTSTIGSTSLPSPSLSSSVKHRSPSSSSSSSAAAPVYQHHLLPPSPPSPPSTPSDNRPYQCHLCTRSFARKHDLQRHIRVHTGDKPYACLCCKKAFARTDALKRHLRVEEACRTSPQIQAMKVTGKRRYKNL